MSAPSGQYFFISYSRADTAQQRKIVAELRARGVNVWVDTKNLVPGSPAWEREIEKSIRGASGIVVLLSPDSNNSEWVRREISFTEEHDKRIFPVIIRGDENDSVPLRLSSHQRVDVRRNMSNGLDDLANALKDHLGVTAVNKKIKVPAKKSFNMPSTAQLKKFALPAALVLVGLVCIGGILFAVRAFANNLPNNPTNTPPATDIDIDITITQTEIEIVTNYPKPTGKIVYTCNIEGDEVCIINADGSDWRRLTDTNQANSNASLSPDGKEIIYVSGNGNKSEIYELNLTSEDTIQLTDLGNSLGAPEISPDNKLIVFHSRTGNSNAQIWIMNRDGSNPRKLYSVSGKDVHTPTWSPDGTQILFALGKGENNQLYIMDINGSESKLVNDTIDTRGRSDWSINNLISFDQGGPFKHDVYLMDVNGSDLRLISPTGMNAQGASLSPDGNWIAFTAYTNVVGQDVNSCDIFIMRVDGTDVRNLTDNNYCDYQPRWGN